MGFENPVYTTGVICDVLGMDKERLRAWQLKGYIKPTKESTGRGDRALFTEADIYGIALFKLLTERGIKRETVSEIIGEFMGTKGFSIFKNLSYIIFGMIDTGEEIKTFSYMVTHGTGEEILLKMDSKMLAVNMILPKNIGATDDRSLFNPKEGVWEDVHIINVMKTRREIKEKLNKRD